MYVIVLWLLMRVSEYNWKHKYSNCCYKSKCHSDNLYSLMVTHPQVTCCYYSWAVQFIAVFDYLAKLSTTRISTAEAL